METKPPSRAVAAFGDIAPDFASLTDDFLFGQIWTRPGMSPRDRSLITCTALVSGGKTEQMVSHFTLALKNGVTRTELIEMVMHMAFYSGWPCAVSALARLKEVFAAVPED